MKLKYLLIPILSVTALLAGCSKEDQVSGGLKEVNIDHSFIAIAQNGGESVINVETTDSWTLEIPQTDDKGKPIEQWFKASPMSGNKGKSTITFSAPKNGSAGDRAMDLKLVVGEKAQLLRIVQKGDGKMVITPIKEVLAAADGGVYTVEGVVTNIQNTLYGNYDIVGKTGTIYVYGTLDKNGAEKNFGKLGIEDGDKVIVTGPRSSYKGSPQLVNVTVVKVQKSLLKIKTTDFTVENAAGVVEVEAVLKSDNISVEPNSKSDWISVKSINKAGEKTIISLAYTENNSLAQRKGQVLVKSGEDMKTITVIQLPRATKEEDIKTVDIKTFLQAKPAFAGPYYRITGKIAEIVSPDYGNFFIEDATGKVFVYGLTAKQLPIGAKNDKSFKTLNLKVGDTITIVGTRGYFAKGAEGQKDQVSGPAFFEKK